MSIPPIPAKRRASIGPRAAALLLLTACSADLTSSPLAAPADVPSSMLGIENNARADTLVVGATLQLNDSTLPRRRGTVAAGQTRWGTSSAQLATVSQTGLVTAVAPGTATITAFNGIAAQSVSIFIPVAVPVGAPVAVSVGVVANAPTLAVGQTTQLAATVKSTSGQVMSGAPVAWVSANTAVATVSGTGLVTAAGAGSVVVTARSGNASGTVTIVVTGPVQTPPPSAAPSAAALPQAYVSSAMPSTSGAVIPVPANGDLQKAIDQARPGDVIELAQGATYVGNFVLPNKGSSTSWIVIRPAAGTPLPAEGQRMTPASAQAARLPRVVTPNVSPAFATAFGAHHYRLMGLELALASQTQAYALVALGTDRPGGQTSLAAVPHDLVLDRMYLHGNATAILRRAVALNSASTAIVDCFMSDIHERGADSQAIMGWNGPGPFKIVNNYLQAAGEVIMFGGSDPGISNLIPSDIEVRHNHLTRPMSWKGVWQVKNLFELKNARRVLVEGNVFENNWDGAQDGTAILFKSVNQEGSAPWSGTSHVTFRRNVLRNVRNGFALGAHPEPWPVELMHHVVVTDNLLDNRGAAVVDNTFRGVLMQGDLADVGFSHNTVVTDGVSISLYLGPQGAHMTRFDFNDNVFTKSTGYGIFGDNRAPGADSWSAYVASGTSRGNVFVGTGGSGGDYPAGNFFVNSTAGVGFAALAAGDFRLGAGSPVKGRATDGRDPGADVDAVLAATAGVVLP